MLMLLCSIAVNAQKFEVGGLYYEITNTENRTVSVTSGENKYTGDVTIPESVTYEGTDYNVTAIGNRAFYECSGLASATIPNSVTSIGNEAFCRCDNMKSVKLPESITIISQGSFSRTGLTSVKIPEGVTRLAMWAFDNSPNLTTVELPTTLTDIGSYVFDQCPSLSEIVIPDNVKSIGISAFDNCTALSKVVLGNGLTNIGSYAFNGATSIKEIVIPNNVTNIGDYAFKGCKNIATLTIGNNVKSIGNHAFSGCNAIGSIEIPNSVTSIGNYAFHKCRNLTNISIGNSVLRIGENAFTECTGLKSIEIPSSVTSFGKALFSSCTSLTDVTLPNSITSVADSTFYNCTGLTKIVIPNSITTIGNYAFKECTLLSDVTLGNSVANIGEAAFYRCNAIESIAIPNSVTTIGGTAFYLCRNLASITIPASVTEIGRFAFGECYALESIELPSSVTNYGVGIFSSCTKLTSAKLPNNITTIPENLFNNCTLLKEIAIPNSVTGIGGWAFGKCTSLTRITIPSNVSSIGDYAFDGCKNLKTVVNYSNLEITKGAYTHGYVGRYANRVFSLYDNQFIGDYIFETIDGIPTLVLYAGNETELTLPENYLGDNYVIGESAFEGSSITKVNIPNAVTSIGNKAFKNCRKLGSINFPKSLTSIGEEAFYLCQSLKFITIPESITNIGNSAFNGCTALKTVINYSGLKINKGSDSYGQVAYFAQLVIQPNDSRYTIVGDYFFEEVEGKQTLILYTGSDKEIILPENCKGENYTIGENAFDNLDITSVIIPNGVTGIGIYAFNNCTKLKNITIPGTVTYIDSRAFNNCNAIERIIVENGNPRYDSRENCNAIIETATNTIVRGCRNTTIPNGITGIGGFAFENCRDLESITIPEGVTSIGNYAFKNCSSLTEIEIPNSITNLGDNVFSGCSNLSSVKLHATISSIGYYTFEDCAITSITIPEGVTAIRAYAFKGCSKLETVELPSTLSEICSYAFSECGSLKEITIPNSVNTILDGAFFGCSSLTEITIPDGIESIAEATFQNCCGLTEITIPEGVTTIGGNAFEGCSKLETVELPSTLTGIEAHAFSGCSSLKEIAIPNSVNTIRGSAFKGCSSLTEITIPEGVSIIDYQAFYGCSNLRTVVLPSTIKSIGSEAFIGCNALATVTSNAVEAPILEQAPFETVRNKELNYPDGSNYIKWGIYFANFESEQTESSIWCFDEEGNAFVTGTGELWHFPNRKIKRLYVEGDFTTIVNGSHDEFREYLEEVYLPQSLTSIGERAFMGCTNLKTIIIPDGVTSIGSYAFSGCKITNIILPEGLKTIGDCAFSDVPLEFVLIPTSLESMGDYAFSSYYFYDQETDEYTHNTPVLVFKTFNGPQMGELGDIYACIPEGANSYPSGKFSNITLFYSQQECYVDYGRMFVFGNTDNVYNNSIINDYKVSDVERIVFTPDATGYNLITSLPDIKEVEVQKTPLKDGNIYTIDGSNAIYRYDEYEPTAKRLIAGCSSTIIPEGTTSIEDYAFYGCQELKEIKIPGSVTRIGYRAFDYCYELKNIEIANGVTEIGEAAFHVCQKLESITIPESVTNIGFGAFDFCTGLRSAVIYGGNITNGLFKDCTNLTDVTIGKNITVITGSAFSGCTALTNLSIDSGNSIYDSRDNCNAIIETATNKLILASKNGCVIPETVNAIAGYAFSACQNYDITVPARVTSFDNYAFRGLNRVYFEAETPAAINGNIFGWGAIYVPTTSYETYCNANIWSNYKDRIVTTEIADKCIEASSTEGMSGVLDAIGLEGANKVVKLKVIGCINSYDIIVFRDKMPLLCELDLSEATVIASSKPFYGNTYCTGNNSLGDYAFYDLDKLINVKLPKNLHTLGNYTFQSCGALRTVDATATAELNIGNYAFNGCSNLEEIIFPEYVSTIGASAFQSCTRLENIRLYNVTGSIGNGAFQNCSNVKSLKSGTIGGYIGSGAFSGCNSLSTIEIESIGGDISSEAFMSCIRLVSLNLDSIAGSIDEFAFYDSSIKEIKIGTIGGNLYSKSLAHCKSLKSVEFNKGPLKVYNGTFELSDSLESFIGGDGMESVEDEAFVAVIYVKNWLGVYEAQETYRTALKRVVLPSTVTKIGNKAFYQCVNLTDFELPKGLTSLGSEAFYNCRSLKSVDIPEGITTIPEYAFSGNTALGSVTFSPKLEEIGTYAFGDCGIEKINLPPRLKSISDYAFRGCNKLTELHIPSSVESIGSYAFSDCSLLNDVYTYTVEPTIITETTFSTFATAILHVPATSFWNYYWDNGWSKFNYKNFVDFNEVYEYFYLNNDYYLDKETGYIEGTPDADMHPGSGLIVSGDDNGSEGPKQNLGDVNLEDDGEGNSAAIIGDQNLHIDNLHVRINVKGGRWYFFAFPWDVPLDKISMDNGSDYVFRYYDGEERAQKGNGGWKDVKEKHLKAAHGYIFQCSGNDVLILSIEDVKFKKEDKYNELVTHVSENLNDASWNLMGNPYLSYYDLADMDYTAPVTVWDGEKYVAIRPGDDDYQFTPYEAFFVQKPEGEESVTFSADGQMTKTQAETDKLQKAAARRVRGIDPQRLLVNMVLSNDITEDRTRVVFNERTTHNYETACDAAKFETAGIPQLYTIDNEGVRYAINERPVGNGVVLIGYTAPAPGYYTIDAPRMDTKVYLYDAQTGEKHHFDEDGEYSFYSEAGTFERRFSLGVRGDDTTGIEEMEDDMEQSTDERAESQTIYDLQGRKHQRSHKGIYIINGEKVVK